MKRFILFAAALMMSALSANLFAQSANNEDEVIKIDKWNREAYREGEILVKFKADGAVQMRAPRKAKFATSHVNAIDALFDELGVDSVEQLMPQTGHKNVGRRVRAYNGSEVVVKNLSKLYRLTLRADKAQDIHSAIERLKAQEEVEFAEPNYLVYTMALPYDSDIPTADQATYTAEPLYSQQWGLAAINLPALWDKPKKSSKRPVIAILDTGVDIEHPDLAANIWTNTAEANGISGQDDDANGFKDDIHGWDFINNHSVTNDFNGHGTHCAGIAAAVGNNGIGITGANPDALIMPVTVMQSNGTGDVATIVKGIDYAAANGADVISMSIGGYGYSLAEEQALGRAYADAVLVAAAGNDGHDLTGYHCISDAPSFPAAFSFVLGVEASMQGVNLETGDNRASFSNFDYDGPIFTRYGEEQLYNYELRAPGVNILSTFPGGRYKVLNGTSMACPLAAGAISRLLQTKEIYSKENLFGDLIHSRPAFRGDLNILSAFNIDDAERHPELELVAFNIVDTLYGDGDGRADAGETFDLYPTIRNSWGQANNIRYWIKIGHGKQGDWVWDDTTLIHSLQDTAYFAKPLSAYAKATARNPYRVTIDPNCSDEREFNVTFYAICDNIADTLKQLVTLTVENGVEIGGMLTEDLTLYPNVHYIVTNNLAIPEGVTLTIKPGTVLKFRDGTGISITEKYSSKTFDYRGHKYTIKYRDPKVDGGIIARGTPDSLIVFSSVGGRDYYDLFFKMQAPCIERIDNMWAGSLFLDTMPQFDSLYKLTSFPIEYVKITDSNIASPYGMNLYMDNCMVVNSSRTAVFGVAKNSVFYNNTSAQYLYYNSSFNGLHSAVHSNFCNNQTTYTSTETAGISNFHECNVFPVETTSSITPPYILWSLASVPTVMKPHANYYGSSKESIIRKYIRDIESGDGFGYYDMSNMMSCPSSKTHGLIWKILIDDIDAQDEFELLPMIGVGRHKCEVYYNRAMDVNIEPTITFGIRKPYNQHVVKEDGAWSADSTRYIAFFTIDDKSVTDGYNTIVVSGGRDSELFPVPDEFKRFHMEVAAAGSMSTGLAAEAGLGKVTLTWETNEEDFADLLGYNLYRWEPDTIWYYYYENGDYKTDYKFDTLCINSSLIDAEDTQFIDYDVVPGKAYYYVIRQMTTALTSYDLSNPVTATPLTAIRGDANGSMSVDVADVITEVNYITGQNPQPFIFEAADVNSDEAVNIIDVVATVNLILNPSNTTSALNEGNVSYSIENGILYVETDVVLGGVQCTFAADNEQVITPLAALDEFEKVGTWQSADQYLFLAYSMSGKTLGVGKHALLQIGDAALTNIVLSDAQGHNIPAAPGVSTALDGTKFVPACSKYIKEGNLFIRLGDRTYDVMGTEVR